MKIFIWSKWIDDIYGGTKPPDGIGGAEVQMAYWAKYFADVNNIVYTFSWRFNFWFKRKHNVFFLPIIWIRKIGIIFNILKYIYLIIFNPDIVVLRSSDDLDILLFFKKILRFKLIFMLAHDFNVMKNKTDDLYGKYWFIRLKKCNLVIAQNKFQSQILNNEFGSNEQIILQPNIYVPLFENEYKSEINFDFLWVGNLKPIKRPDWYINLAEKFPQFTFGMIGKNHNNLIFEQIIVKGKWIKNFTYLGYLSLEETLKYISSSKVLINTSEFEGFPNVLIQAWFYNKPVISTVNPDDVFEKYKIGYFVENEIELTEKAYDLMSKNNIYNLFSSNTKQIFQNYHNPEMAYKKILNKINLDNES